MFSFCLIQKIPNDIVISEAQCLKPQNRCEVGTVNSISKVASKINLLPPLNSDTISDEWRTLQCENIPQDWYIGSEGNFLRVDSYYNKIFSLKNDRGDQKYPELTRLIKSILVIPHGNADVERGFSQVSNYLTEARIQLSERSVSAIQTAKDGLKRFENEAHCVPITKELIQKVLIILTS